MDSDNREKCHGQKPDHMRLDRRTSHTASLNADGQPLGTQPKLAVTTTLPTAPANVKHSPIEYRPSHPRTSSLSSRGPFFPVHTAGDTVTVHVNPNSALQRRLSQAPSNTPRSGKTPIDDDTANIADAHMKSEVEVDLEEADMLHSINLGPACPLTQIIDYDPEDNSFDGESWKKVSSSPDGVVDDWQLIYSTTHTESHSPSLNPEALEGDALREAENSDPGQTGNGLHIRIGGRNIRRPLWWDATMVWARDAVTVGNAVLLVRNLVRLRTGI